ncbi:uncharacterized protein TNCV_347061 [Trichonephila clavipes]|nr:uncharacterized protein TNCV_347061 [Trichonephila clavipes]
MFSIDAHTYALFVGYKQSLDNARSIAFSQRTSSTCLIEDETFNDSDLINNLIDYEVGQEKPYSLREIQYMQRFDIPSNRKKHFLKIDTDSERSLKFQKELRSCRSGYRDVHEQLTNQPSSQKLITYFIVPKNQSIENVSSNDESYFELIHHKKMCVVDYDD